MGKGEHEKKNKNVFKVAGARSLKAKSKAKAVSTQLKKLTEVTKQKTVEVDKLLEELQETVRQSPTFNRKEKILQNKNEKSVQEKIDEFEKVEEHSFETLNKFNKMEV